MTLVSKFLAGLGLISLACLAGPVAAITQVNDPNGQFVLVRFDVGRSSNYAQDYGQIAFGTDLATINSAADVQAALDLFALGEFSAAGGANIHFGLRITDLFCSATFLDGTASTFEFWASGQPSLCIIRSAVVMNAGTGRWNTTERTTAVDTYAIYNDVASPVPLPSNAPLLVIGLAVLGLVRLKLRKS